MAEFVYKQETVAEGEKAKWPFEDDYTDPTKLSYWVSSVKGKMITSGVTIQDVPIDDDDMLSIVFDGSGSSKERNCDININFTSSEGLRYQFKYGIYQSAT